MSCFCLFQKAHKPLLLSAIGVGLFAVGQAQAGPGLLANSSILDRPVNAGYAEIIKVDGGGGDGARVTLARRLQKRLRAKAKARGLDPSKIRIDPATVPYNISGPYAKKTYYNFLTEKR